jgi:hypothetical protein
MGSAIGGGSGPRSPNGSFWIDVRDYGARTDYGFDNTPVFQAAVDAMAAQLNAARSANPALRVVGTIYVAKSAGYYYFSAPVWVDSPFIEIRGDGEGSTLAMHNSVCHPIFIFGLRRQVAAGPGVPKLLVADASYRPDLFGKLDSSAVTSAGQRWGFRSNGDSLIQSQGSPLSSGGTGSFGTPDNWAETSTLTVEVALEGPTGGVMPGNIPIAGLGVATKGQLYPFTLYTDAPNSYVVLFCTQASQFGPLTTRRFGFSSGTATGVQKIAFQIDLNAAGVSAFVNGLQVSTVNNLGADFASGFRFAENDYYPLLIGDSGGNRPSLGNVGGFDFNLYGFCISRTIRYQSNGVALPQRRVDNPATPITDLYRYFTPRFSPATEIDNGTIGYLSFTDAPGGRLLTVQGGVASNTCQSSAFLLHSLMTVPGGIVQNSLCDVQLIGGNLYGQNVAVGQVIELKIKGVRSSTAYHAIGSLSNGANYTIRLEECYLDGCDSGYFALDQIVWARNVTFASAGRATMRFVGCNVAADNVTVEFGAQRNQSTIKIHTGDYGGNYSFRNLAVDYEGDAYLHAAIYCENHPYVSSTSLRLEDVYLGSIGNVPLIMLKEVDPSFPKGTLMVDNLQAYTDQFRAVIDVDGPNWYGEVKNLAVGEAPRIVEEASFGPTCNIVIRETRYKAPPRSHLWYAGAHIFEVRSPADGQFSEWRCVASGTYGTANPPLWAGMNPLSSGASSIAGYILTHGYITASLS